MSTPPSSLFPPSPKRLLFLVGVVTTVGLTYLLRGVLVPLFFAFLLAYALDPFVDRLEALKVPRTLGAVLMMVLICGATITALVLAVPYVIDEFRLAGEQFPEQMRALKERIDPWVWQVFHINLPHTWGELASKIADEMRARTPDLIQGSMVALFGTLNVILIVVATLIVPVFALYLLIDFDRNVERAKWLIPRRWAPIVGSVAAEVHRTLGGYVRGSSPRASCFPLYSAGLMLAGFGSRCQSGFSPACSPSCPTSASASGCRWRSGWRCSVGRA